VRGGAEAVALPSGLASGGIAYPLPGGELTSIEALAFTVTTAAGGGARQVLAQLVDALSVPVFTVAAPGTQAGGLTVRYSFAPDVPAFGSSGLGAMGGPFPRARWADNLELFVTVANTSAADTIFDGRLVVHQHER
jgi:hypothetical protein